ncbi:hypothetical protein P175DRAFT_0502205 [Aspergillus ochraceoroseus IBT 24754]|uniref:Transmembrane protein n=3 Tax=Aspergillus subgen. Nidulantes TaxID=2720870 RepID=A0A0F8UH18_9EURO|nr:uncharacterized protein P175DRAFT_0502205 [Aspergillus ochraceoroseus IBT 24754]KKK17547.1 hypothetical protein AOCH_003860 [Aspergillus ochraceoroseus]KKK18984.1 hypothetical protein ARAM_001488 [Aspergillus rambellii]PTU20058.1 hypothetical protein P175DRAFT_0502205 [Aspergillus ochraceoroseus IBT 24754]
MSAIPAYSAFAIAILFTHVTAQYSYGDTDDPNVAGASGPDSGSGGISTAGIIALGVIAGVVVVLGISSAALFYVAKKRQWAMREALRRSARTVVKAVMTPLTPRFPKSARSTRPPTRDREEEDNELRRTERRYRNPLDPEKDAVVTAKESPKETGSNIRGWSSYFSFNRS